MACGLTPLGRLGVGCRRCRSQADALSGNPPAKSPETDPGAVPRWPRSATGRPAPRPLQRAQCLGLSSSKMKYTGLDLGSDSVSGPVCSAVSGFGGFHSMAVFDLVSQLCLWLQ